MLQQYPGKAGLLINNQTSDKQANDCIAVARPRAQPVTPDTRSTATDTQDGRKLCLWTVEEVPRQSQSR
ncbi:hypothetical protein CHR62_09300 [Pusillimonas sp. NJUB218]|nr:hypothetical protein CHR62_09300 [Pusillimonas sp. NJUB218]